MTVWEQRDLPVLSALASTDDQQVRSGFLDISLAQETLGVDLTGSEIHDSILTLAEVDYIDCDVGYETGGGGMFTKLKVTGRGQQALGEWPLFTEVRPATLAALLDRFADEAETDEEGANARKAATYVRSVSGATFKAILRTVAVEGAKATFGLLT